MPDEEVEMDDSPPHAWPDDGSAPEPVPADVERVAQYHSERSYLLRDSSADPLRVQGPVEESVREGDIILAYVPDIKHQWACQVTKIYPDLSVDVIRV
jgi:hypothetical protein